MFSSSHELLAVVNVYGKKHNRRIKSIVIGPKLINPNRAHRHLCPFDARHQLHQLICPISVTKES
tara:strand:- start:238 stop:432 length:195 start_codon:yes stop_codon:yes gene_type:complete